MKLKMTEVQKAYLLGRNETFQGKTGTHFYLELDFHGDMKRLNDALNQLIEKQPMLRASVLDLEHFQIEPPFHYDIHVENVIDNDKEAIMACIEEKRNRLSHKLYESQSFPFFTIECIETKKDKYYLFFSLDLLIADGLSVFQLFDQWRDIYYDNKSQLDDMTDNLLIINKSYHEEKCSRRYDKAKAFWLREIEQLPDAPDLVLHTERQAYSKFKRLEHYFSEKDYNKMLAFADGLDLSMNTVFMTLYAAVLQRWSANPSFTINMTTFKRPRRPEYMSVIGDFTSTCLVRTDINPMATLTENVQALQRTIKDCFRYSAFEGIEVLRELSKMSGRSNSMPFVFTSMLFDIKNYDSFMKMNYWISETPQVYLDCQIKLFNGQLHISWDYLDQLFEPSQIREMFHAYIDLVGLLLTAGDQTLISFQRERIALAEQRYQDYNLQAIQPVEEHLILDLYKKIVDVYPDNIAFQEMLHSISFKEMEERSGIICDKIHKLKQKYGLGKVRITILTKKSIQGMVEMLAVVKTGDSFCFVDPKLPEDRINYIMSEINTEIIIEAGMVSVVKDNIGDSFIPMDELYVIFTSGTTGRPKGISINQQAALNTIFDLHHKLHASVKDVIFNISELSFDLSVFDTLSPLLIGCKTILCKNVHEMSSYRTYLPEVTIWNSTPGLVQRALAEYTNQSENMRCILMSGDFIPVQIVKDIKETFHRQDLHVLSLGGATEVSIWSIYYPLSDIFDKKRIPYGYPLANQYIYVLDSDDKPTEPEVFGEICIGGKGLANGYMDEIKTKEAFFHHDRLGRLYRTGDKGYMSHEGHIEIVGRMQHELKVNGYRIDLVEIGNALNQLNAIEQSKVFVKTNKNKSELVAVYTMKNCGQLQASYLRNNLRRVLPDYMIPTTFFKVDCIPLNTNGKVDTVQLQQWLSEMREAELTIEESTLLDLWMKVIGPEGEELKQSYGNFFDAGGDSIKLPELLHAIQEQYQIQLTIDDLLNHFSLMDQAIMVTSKSKTKTGMNQKLHKQVVKLTNGKTEKNIVLIHAGSGETAIYNHLARLLDPDYSVYAVKFNKQYSDVAARTIDLSELAGHYNEALKMSGIDRLDYVGGWCIGGAIAFEMAKKNPAIEKLLLINSMPPVTESILKFDHSLEAELQFVESSIGLTLPGGITNTFTLWNGIIAVMEERPELMPQLISIVPPELSRLIPYFGNNKPRELIYYINLFRSFENARFCYENIEQLSIPVLYVGAQDEMVDNYQHWAQHTSGNWQESHVKGDHTTIFSEQYVDGLAEIINHLMTSSCELAIH
ncbi:hypothetical protein A8L34_12055 [Bacillus sp. FJAT-27264]|uniref:alpha/beta fold hydrolase n=1 Tax=Paenibacillus sp. (strain DSM 101736 / FJAT-27264) TaxID=1850362 RepID=UPI000807E245|nr:alpha/beta fold hydrolase [Bacillus sp. FJAT-27264]OBZ14647.1 hypothetical protein A8L34_12055 [Bacillus sp. FJAT-27264]